MPLDLGNLSDRVSVEELQNVARNLIVSLNDTVNVLSVSSINPKVYDVSVRVLRDFFS
jgi:hypothetical protein